MESLEIKVVFRVSSKCYVIILLPLLFLRFFYLLSLQTQAKAIKRLLCERAPLALIMWQLCIALAAKVLRVETDPTGTSATSPSEGRYCTLKPLGTT